MRILLLAFAVSAAAPTGTLHGLVVDESGSPVPYANVVLLGTRTGAQAGENGRFEIRSAPVGMWRLRALMLGVEGVVDSVVVREGADDSLRVVAKRRYPKGYSWSGRKLGRPTSHCDSTEASSSPLAGHSRVSTKGWQWVGRSSFDFQLPNSYHLPERTGIGIDSEVGQWVHGTAEVWYDLGDYTGIQSSGERYVSATECLDGVPVELSMYVAHDPRRYAVQLSVSEIGLGIFGFTKDEKERDALLSGFRTLRFHEPHRRK